MGWPIPSVTQERMGASAVVLSPIASREEPRYDGIGEALAHERTYVRVFGKPYTKLNRRMGVVLCYEPLGGNMDALRDKAKSIAGLIKVY